MQIESYRNRLEEFEQNLNRELYHDRSGLKDQLELVALYSDYSDLFCTESIREVEAELDKEPFASAGRAWKNTRIPDRGLALISMRRRSRKRYPGSALAARAADSCGRVGED